jgi:hypothetical protein
MTAAGSYDGAVGLQQQPGGASPLSVSQQRALVFALDLKAGEKWRVPGKFMGVADEDAGDVRLFALRDDDVLVQLDRSTGKVVSPPASRSSATASTPSPPTASPIRSSFPLSD